MDVLKNVSWRNFDKVCIPVVGHYGNPVEAFHVRSIGDPASEPAWVFWISRNLVNKGGNGGRAAFVWRCLKESLHEAHHEGFEDAQAAAPDGDVTPFTDSDVAEWRLLGNGKNTNCWLPLRRNNTDNRLTGSTGQILVFFYETLFI